MREEIWEMKDYIWEVEVSILDVVVIFVNAGMIAIAALLCIYAMLCRRREFTGIIQPFPFSYLDDATTYKFYRTSDPRTPNRRRQFLGKGRKDKTFASKDELECITCKTKVPVEFSSY